MGNRTGRKRRVNGVVLWRGKSLLNGKPIVVIVTGFAERSRNEKTGDMLQLWILPADTDPNVAVQTGEDESVCGNCRSRPILGGACYVKTFQASLQVWKAWKAGNYPRFDELAHLSLFRGRLIRLGAYGDPAAVPLDVFLPLLVTVDGHSGYTHQWRTTDQDWRRFVMASCDTEQEALQAESKGWRHFRVREEGAPLMKGEFSCPASTEAGKRRSCATCRACDGATDSGKGSSPSIVVHGATAGRFALQLV